MAIFSNQATLTYNGSSTNSNIAYGEILDVLAATKTAVEALADQLIRGNGGIHIRAGHQHTHALQDQTQGAHGDTADAHQMDMLARRQIIFNKLIMFNHVFQISR